MEQTSKDLENIKSKLIEHIKSVYDEKQANEYISNINSMDESQFIEFLKQQGLLKKDGTPNQKSQCIFCSIIFGDIPSTKIGENEKAIAILDINPSSIGHSLIIPKEHLRSKEKIDEEIKKLAFQIQEKIQKTFNPKKIDLIYSNTLGHEIINILPIYKNETIESERKKLSPEELTKIKEKIDEISIEKKENENSKEEKIERKKIDEKNMWLPKRIP